MAEVAPNNCELFSSASPRNGMNFRERQSFNMLNQTYQNFVYSALVIIIIYNNEIIMIKWTRRTPDYYFVRRNGHNANTPATNARTSSDRVRAPKDTDIFAIHSSATAQSAENMAKKLALLKRKAKISEWRGADVSPASIPRFLHNIPILLWINSRPKIVSVCVYMPWSTHSPALWSTASAKGRKATNVTS